MKHTSHTARVPLANLPAGRRARLAEVGAVDTALAEQLAAYGLQSGSELRVMQQQPMTLIVTDELELALEPGVAREIWVEPMP